MGGEPIANSLSRHISLLRFQGFPSSRILGDTGSGGFWDWGSRRFEESAPRGFGYRGGWEIGGFGCWVARSLRDPEDARIGEWRIGRFGEWAIGGLGIRRFGNLGMREVEEPKIGGASKIGRSEDSDLRYWKIYRAPFLEFRNSEFSVSRALGKFRENEPRSSITRESDPRRTRNFGSRFFGLGAEVRGSRPGEPAPPVNSQAPSGPGPGRGSPFVFPEDLPRAFCVSKTAILRFFFRGPRYSSLLLFGACFVKKRVAPGGNSHSF